MWYSCRGEGFIQNFVSLIISWHLSPLAESSFYTQFFSWGLLLLFLFASHAVCSLWCLSQCLLVILKGKWKLLCVFPDPHIFIYEHLFSPCFSFTVHNSVMTARLLSLFSFLGVFVYSFVNELFRIQTSCGNGTLFP